MHRRDDKRSSLLEAVPTKVLQRLASQCHWTKLEELSKDTYTIVYATSTKCTRLHLDLT